MNCPGLSGNALADLYIRLRNEIDCGERNLDPNNKLRASIAMAILSVEGASDSNIAGIEARVRHMLGLTTRAVEDSALHSPSGAEASLASKGLSVVECFETDCGVT